MVPRAGVEPTTLSLGRICSIQLSYRGMLIILTDEDGKVGEVIYERPLQPE
jgi:hypothetical protein